MRSTRLILAALLSVAPCAFAAGIYTNPVSAMHPAKPATVFVTFSNRTVQERDVHVAGVKYSIPSNHSLNLRVPADGTVRVTSDVNSRVDQQMLVAGTTTREIRLQ